MIRILLYLLGGSAWLFLSFLAGVYLTFPGEAARDWLQYRIAEGSKDEYAIEMDPVGLWWFPGVKADNVTLYSVKKGRKAKGEEEPAPLERAPVAHLDSLAARVQVLPRLFGKWSYGFSGELNGGDLSGKYADSDAATELVLSTSGIDLSRSPVDNDTAQINLLGKVDIDCDLRIDKEEIKSSSGSLSVDLRELAIGAGSKVSGFDLPEVAFTKSSVAFEVKEGKLEVTDGSFTSDVVNATLSGDISLNKKLARSRYRLELAFTLPEDIDRLAQVVPDMKRARDKDGNYHLMISGNLFNPKFRTGKGLSKKRGGDDLMLGGEPGAGAELSDEERDERRKRREERIKERRERMKERRAKAGGRNPEVDPQDELLPPGEERIPVDDAAPMPPNPEDMPPDMPDIGPPPQEPFDPPADEEQ